MEPKTSTNICSTVVGVTLLELLRLSAVLTFAAQLVDLVLAHSGRRHSGTIYQCAYDWLENG